MNVRDVRWADLSVLAGYERDLFAADAWSEATWWAELAGRPRREYVLAQVGRDAAADAAPADDASDAGDGTIVGYAGLDHAGAVADVMTLAVAAPYRGRGVGDLLVGELVRRAEAGGADAVMLEVRADNPAALALYERHGFAQVSMRPRYYQPGDVDALVLRRTVGR